MLPFTSREMVEAKAKEVDENKTVLIQSKTNCKAMERQMHTIAQQLAE